MLKLRARDGATFVVENFIVFRFVQAYLYTHAGKRVGLSGIGHFIRRYRNATAVLG